MNVPEDVRSSVNFIIGFNYQKRNVDYFCNNVSSRYIDKQDFKRLIEREWKVNPETGHSGYVAVNQQTNVYKYIYLIKRDGCNF